jgi:predicted aspartyl protease
MGHFFVDCEITHIRNPKKTTKVPRLLVDTGSEYTWISGETLRQIGVTIRKKDVPFLMANGQTITRPIGYAILQAAGFETVDEVVFGEAGDLQLLGSRTLEGFGAMVDARKKRLVAAGPIPAAASERGRYVMTRTKNGRLNQDSLCELLMLILAKHGNKLPMVRAINEVDDYLCDTGQRQDVDTECNNKNDLDNGEDDLRYARLKGEQVGWLKRNASNQPWELTESGIQQARNIMAAGFYDV